MNILNIYTILLFVSLFGLTTVSAQLTSSDKPIVISDSGSISQSNSSLTQSAIGITDTLQKSDSTTKITQSLMVPSDSNTSISIQTSEPKHTTPNPSITDAKPFLDTNTNTPMEDPCPTERVKIKMISGKRSISNLQTTLDGFCRKMNKIFEERQSVYSSLYDEVCVQFEISGKNTVKNADIVFSTTKDTVLTNAILSGSKSLYFTSDNYSGDALFVYRLDLGVDNGIEIAKSNTVESDSNRYSKNQLGEKLSSYSRLHSTGKELSATGWVLLGFGGAFFISGKITSNTHPESNAIRPLTYLGAVAMTFGIPIGTVGGILKMIGSTKKKEYEYRYDQSSKAQE